MAKKKQPRERSAVSDGDCLIPPALPKAELHKLLFKHSEREAQGIKDYVEWQAHGEEKVLHVEKVASERIFGREHGVWDVHTDKERWWVVTGPTNLYSQSLMPSLDYTLSFHIGLMARVAARRQPEGSEAEQEFLLVTNRKMVQASEAFDQADEAEEFQVVGMRCRECLLALVRELTTGSDIAAGADVPKAADFPGWNERIANAIAPGGSAEYVRGYLKTTGERAWRLVNWLTHAVNATRNDAELALSVTSHVINNFTASVLKRKIGAPERCARCKSYRISVDWRPELGSTGLYVPRCEACGAEKLPSALPRQRRKRIVAQVRRARNDRP
jgi:predicted Zn-ribbon and HTH transcriptional regulator